MVLTLSVDSFAMEAGFYAEGGKRLFQLSVHRRMTPDDFYLKLARLCDDGLSGERPTGAVIASVAPRLTQAAAGGAERLCGAPPCIIGPGVKTGIDIKINDPSQLGADLVAMSAGLAAKYPLPALLVSVGVATTLSYIDERSRYLGTVIAPGLGPGLQALVESAELLNPVPLAAPERVLGANTEESLRSGLIYGTAGMIDALAGRILAERPAGTLVATGGDAALAVLPHCRTPLCYDGGLLSDGMYHIFCRQTGRRAGE